MRVRIIEKIYHRTNNPNLATPLRRQKEDYWIRELTTAIPYGCNDKIDGIGIQSSPTCRSVNVVYIFNSTSLRKQSHSGRHYTSPHYYTSWCFTKWPSTIYADTVGHPSYSLSAIFTTPFRATYHSCLVNHVKHPNSNEYKLSETVVCQQRSWWH